MAIYKKYINRFFTAALLLVGLNLYSQGIIDYPACVSVDPTGTIAVNISVDYSAMFTSTNLGGPYSQVIVTDTSMLGDTIVFNNFNGNNQVHWFYFDALLFSDTISNIILTVDPLNSAGIAKLSWNIPFAPGSEVLNQAGSFIVNRKFSSDTEWIEIANVPLDDNLYLDTIAICSDSINYRITLPLKNSNGDTCSFISSVDGDNFNNNIPPDIPDIVRVSVDTASGFGMIQWRKPPQADLNGYVVFENFGNDTNNPLDIVDKDSLTYTDLNSDVNNQIHSYGIAAFDTCIIPETDPPIYYISPPTADSAVHHTILLNVDLSPCDSLNELTWNKYDNWPEGVSKYEIYSSKNGNAYQLLAALDSSITSYQHYHPLYTDIYCYMVKATDGSGQITSLSNIRCQDLNYPKLPDVVYLSTVNIDFSNNNQVNLNLYISDEEGIDIQGFSVEGNYPATADYNKIGFLLYTGQTNISFTDNTVTGDLGELWYRVQVIDGCGVENIYSNEINSINLEIITDNEQATNTLVWNSALGRAGDITGYKLYRVQNVSGNIVSLFYEADEFQNFFIDDLWDFWEEDGGYCYVVEAIEENNPYDTDTTGFSNQACGLIETRVWIPNAFVVDGSSPTFTPVLAYADLSEYKMQIINRKGQLLYTSEDVYVGWDGYYKGHPVMDGVYVYVIDFQDGFGNRFTETGTVTVFSHY